MQSTVDRTFSRGQQFSVKVLCIVTQNAYRAEIQKLVYSGDLRSVTLSANGKYPSQYCQID